MQTAELLALNVLACPDCGAEAEGLSQCNACGLEFETEDGLPRLFPKQPRAVSFACLSEQFAPDWLDGAAVFRFPKVHGQAGSGVYHLDAAHVSILETLPKGSIILETGCGGAQLRKWANERGLIYIGTDVSKTRVHEWLRDYGGADLLCDAHALPLKDSSVDVVYAAAVWEHLAFPQLAAQEAYRVLKPGGYMLGGVSFLEPWHDQSYYHMSPNGVNFTLRTAGLRPIMIWPELSWPGFVAIMKMGNKATMALAFLGRLLNRLYLAPKLLQFALRTKRRPSSDDLYETYGKIAGAITWIAQKPADDAMETS